MTITGMLVASSDVELAPAVSDCEDASLVFEGEGASAVFDCAVAKTAARRKKAKRNLVGLGACTFETFPAKIAARPKTDRRAGQSVLMS